MPSFTVVSDLLKEIDVPQNGTTSKTIYQDKAIKLVIVGSSGGQELSQMTEAAAAAVEILKGDVRLTLNAEVQELSAGSWIFLEANLPYTVYTRTPVVMLLTMLAAHQPK